MKTALVVAFALSVLISSWNISANSIQTQVETEAVRCVPCEGF